MAVGKGKILQNGKVRPIDLGMGDRVLFGTYSGTEVKVAGEELIVARGRQHGRHRRAAGRTEGLSGGQDMAVKEVRFSEDACPGPSGASAGARRGGLESAPPNPICAARCS
jgi:hypothetical protein